MLAKRDPYLVMGVRPIDKPEEIKRSYRELSKKYHPDMNKGNEEVAAQKMKELVAAHEILEDREKRKEYDEQPIFRPRQSRRMGKVTGKHLAHSRKKQERGGLWQKIVSLFIVPGPPRPDPEAANAHFSLGTTMVDNAAFFDQAKAEFEEAVRNDPNFFEAWYNLGLMCYKLGEWENARTAFKKAIEIKDDRGARVILDLIRGEPL